jgi:hypothetical protein
MTLASDNSVHFDFFYKSLTNTFIYIVVIGLHLELFQQAHCIRKYFLHAATVSSDVH